MTAPPARSEPTPPNRAATPSAPPPEASRAAANLSTASDPAEIWNALLASIAHRNALSWVRWLRLVRIAEDKAVITAQPGRREMLNFLASDRQRGQLAELLRSIVGRSLRIEVEQPTPGAEASPGDEGDAPAAEGGMSRREALSLPLVKQVLEVFDADLIDVRPRKPLNE